ncbi:hypothetical protein KKF91_06245 [Myxococcota bacterium]|nr:hypothetical protein [Myxococcota bacterium]MBU1430153.1 hypothetical protein [Myxococcota bacterium]MBU1899406.1 hypothetical protein [Myxococcota bacterium]
MKWLSLMSLALLLWACEGDDDPSEVSNIPDATAELEGEGGGEIWIEPLAAAILEGEQSVEIGLRGAGGAVELRLDGVTVAQGEANGEAALTLSLDTTQISDGPHRLTAHAAGIESPALDVDIDNTPPALVFEMKRLPILSGLTYLPFQLDEAYPAEVQVIYEGEVIATTDGVDNVPLSAALLPDGRRFIHLKAIDQLGREVESDPVECVVVNNGKRAVVEYIPSPVATVPEDYQSVDYHTRVMVPSEPGVKRILTWLTWDNPDWTLEFAMGQGTCPHRGITYTSEVSSEGEVIIDLAKVDLSASAQMSFSQAQREADTFPVNNDPATFGAFFGHIDPKEPADHVGQSIPIEINMVLFY